MIGRKTKGITRLKKLSAYQVLEILFPVAFHYGMMLLAAMLTEIFWMQLPRLRWQLFWPSLSMDAL